MKSIRMSVLSLAALAALALASAAPAQNPPIRIMPLGDSITYGAGSAGGYRTPLYRLLTNLNFNVDFVGSQTTNPDANLPDLDHEGHSGWTIGGIDGGILGWFDAVADPDVILLHIGTNDSGGGNAFTNMVSNLDALVTKMSLARPYAHIIVSSLLKRGEPNYTAITNYFNPFIPGKVAAQQALGRRVTYLDMHAGLDLSDTYDNLHPNQVGYNKMATNWVTAITNVISPSGDWAPPGLYRARGITNRTQVALTFSKPLAGASATNPANYALSGGLTVSGATLSADQHTVTLTTSLQTLSSNYVVTVNNVTDRSTPTPLAVAANSTAAFYGTTPRGYLNNVPESSAYSLVYSLEVPASADYKNNPVLYATDNSALLSPSFRRVAYYMELMTATGDVQYVWASMDAFTNSAAALGVPTIASGALFQRPVANLTVRSNVAGVTNGTGFAGNLEFWPSNYSSPNFAGVLGADGGIYDFGDQRDPGTYGSMQVHNTSARQTALALNNWGGSGGNICIGIGNCPAPSGGGVDWTFSQNGANFTVRSLQILVLADTDTVAPTMLSAQAGFARTLVTVQFSEPLTPSSVNGSCFTLNSGVEVISATLSSNLREVVLVTTPQPAGAPLTLSVTGVRDASVAANPVVPGSTIGVSASGLPPEVAANAGALANGYQLIYTLDIPVTGTFNGAANPYRYNQSLSTNAFDRIAYYLELAKLDGTVQYVWASMDAFTPYLSQIGVPLAANRVTFQQYVNNLDVKSNVAGITNGTGLAGGNLEFWAGSFTQTNTAAVPGASSTAFDFGDSIGAATAGHGSMQLHNSTFKHTLFAMNNWGTDAQTLAIGIGNRSGSADTDWTGAANAASYSRRTLHVLVRPAAASSNGIPAEVLANLPNLAGYQLVCSITNIPVAGNFQGNFTNAYSFDNTARIGGFSRVAYYLALQANAAAPTQFIWTAMDAFTTDARRLAVPTNGTFFQQKVTNLDVLSNVASITNGTGITTGNIEFWPSNYSQPNLLPVPNASASYFDFGDSGGSASPGGYGCMQVHNHALTAKQTLFAINHAGSNGQTLDLGIGNRPANNDTDWTFASNAGSYNQRVLHVFVLPGGDADFTRPTLSGAKASLSMTQVTVTFSEALADSAATASFYTLTNNGVGVTGAKLMPNKTDVILTTTALTPGQAYALSVTGVRDRASNGNLIVPGSTLAFTAPSTATPSVLTNVAEIGDYSLIHLLAVANTTSYAGGAPYSVDESRYYPTRPFDRIAYCMELLGTNGVYKWVYTSMDAFTTDLTKIGVPTADRGAMYQQYVSNLNVYASGNAAVTTGVGIATGNIEFWPSNYGAGNDKAIPNAASTVTTSGGTTNVYDFGDGGGPGVSAGHGSMQIHNWGMSHTIFAMNAFGSNGRTPALGIGNNTLFTSAGNWDTDWTFNYNAPAYATKNIYVLVRWGGTPQGTGPAILVQPAGRTIRSGASAIFAVQAVNASSYQWRRNGTAVPGATQAWLEIAPADAFDAGAYDVLVYGTGTASTLSQSATLSVIPAGTVMRVQ